MNKEIFQEIFKEMFKKQFNHVGLSLNVGLTVISFLVPVVYFGLFLSSSIQVSCFCSQQFAYFGNSENNLPPETSDGGSRFSQPQPQHDLNETVPSSDLTF